MALLGERGKIFLILFVLWCAYIVIGIFVFAAAEGNVQQENHEQIEARKAEMIEKHNMTAAEYEAHQKRDDWYGRRWSYGDSFWFVVVLTTTIGYGDLTPVTSLGKVLCVVYALFGIPITILLLRFIGQQMLRGQRSLITAIESRCLGRNGPPRHLNEKCFLLGFVYLLLVLLIGAAAQMTAEDWCYGDSLYFYVITFTTVGFGDLVPSAKYISIPFTFLGLTAISNLLHAAASMAVIRRVTAGSHDEEDSEKTEKAAEV